MSATYFVRPSAPEASRRAQRVSPAARRSAETSADDTQNWVRALAGRLTDQGLDAAGAWQRVAAVHQAVRIRANALKGIPFVLEADGGAEVFSSLDPKEVAAVPYARALPTMFWLFAASAVLTGRAYAAKGNPEGSRRVDRLIYFDPRTIEIKAEHVNRDEGTIEKYVRQAAGMDEPEEIEADKMIALHAPDPFVEIGPGAAPMRAALIGARVLDAVATFTFGHVDGGLTKSHYFTVSDPSGEGRTPSEPAVREMKVNLWKWIKNRGRIRVPEDITILGEDVAIHEVGEGLGDLADKDLDQAYWRAVASAFDVPFALMFENAANYATLMLQLYQLYMSAVFADADMIAEAFNEQLFAGAGVRLVWQKHLVEAVQFAEVQKAQSVQLLTGGAPVMTREEARTWLGLDQRFGDAPRADDEDLMPTNGQADALPEGI